MYVVRAPLCFYTILIFFQLHSVLNISPASHRFHRCNSR